MFPFISIIVPIYKVEPYIHKCLESLILQTFKNFEVILVDDGSPDNCPHICDEYANNYSFIKTIHKQNGGLSSARNAGMAIALGKYIMFIDSDDYIHPNTCKLMYDAISSNPNAWVFCNMARVNEQNKVISVVDEQQASKIFKSNPTYYGSFKLSLSGSCCNKIYNMNIIRQNNFRFDESIRFGEDVPFDSPYCAKCNEIIFIPTPLYFYRVVEGSLTHSYHANHLEVYIKLFACRLPLIKNNEIPMFCDDYLYYFITLLDNAMDKRNPMSFLAKMRYNNRMMKSEEFRFCVANASGKNDSKLFMKVVRMHNYYIYWAFQKFCKLKNKVLRKNKSENKE